MLVIEPLEQRDEQGKPNGKYCLVAHDPEKEDVFVPCCNHEHNNALQASRCNDALTTMRQIENAANQQITPGQGDVFEERALAFAVDFMISRAESFQRVVINMRMKKVLHPDGRAFTKKEIEQADQAGQTLLYTAGIVDQELKAIVQQRNQAAVNNLKMPQQQNESERDLPKLSALSH